MQKTLSIEGMSCGHCVARVEKALGGLTGVSDVKVDLSAKNATMQVTGEVQDAQLKEVVEDAGYDVTKIE